MLRTRMTAPLQQLAASACRQRQCIASCAVACGKWPLSRETSTGSASDQLQPDPVGMTLCLLPWCRVTRPMPPSSSRMPRSQINYMLGDAGRSYVVGFGKDPPSHPLPQVVSIPAYPSAPVKGAPSWTSRPRNNGLEVALLTTEKDL